LDLKRLRTTGLNHVAVLIPQTVFLDEQIEVFFLLV
jgi:hypothetical protein